MSVLSDPVRGVLRFGRFVLVLTPGGITPPQPPQPPIATFSDGSVAQFSDGSNLTFSG